MILDGFLQFTAAAFDIPTTGSQVSTNQLDLGIIGLPTSASGGGARDIGIGDDPAMKLLVIVQTAFTVGTSLQVNVQGAPDYWQAPRLPRPRSARSARTIQRSARWLSARHHHRQLRSLMMKNFLHRWGTSFALLLLLCSVGAAQVINQSLQLSQDPRGQFGVDTNGNLYIQNNRHLLFQLGTTALPTVAGAGCVVTAGSTDANGQVTGCSAAAAVTFSQAYVTAPRCIASSSSATNV